MLPPAYNFEVGKCRRKILEHAAKRVCLQLPEGLMVWSEALAYELEQGTNAEVLVIGDVTYGACCIDDHKAKYLNCDLLIHYGHSCLVPVDSVDIPCLYVFVEIQLNAEHLAQYLDSLFPSYKALTLDPSASQHHPPEKKTVVALMGTIQFSNAIHAARHLLTKRWEEREDIEIIIPQCAPLTPGETLGCTSPTLPPEVTNVLFVADGRFHLEGLMIQNPQVPEFLRYDPFTKKVFKERLDHDALQDSRQEAIELARTKTTHVCLILSTLGRQGSVGLLERLEEKFKATGYRVMKILIAELKADTLKQVARGAPEGSTVAFINVGCPRLPMDWGKEFVGPEHPFLSTYEAVQAYFVQEPVRRHEMDYFSASGGEWSNYYGGCSRNGSIGRGEKLSRAAALRERWLARRAQMQQHAS